MRRGYWLLVGLLLLTLATGLSAQTDPPPMLAVLAAVPDTPNARSVLGYADYAAIMGEATTEDDRLRSLGIVMSGPEFNNVEARLESQETLIGVPMLAMEQGATWGMPPAQAYLYQGAFDPAAIQAAYDARDYSSEALGDLTLFCGPEGCDSGMTVDPAGRQQGDPFGGQLGRPQPVLLAPFSGGSQLISAPAFEVLTASADALDGTVPSLADSPDIQAAVRALLASGDLLQAYFLSPDAVGPSPDGKGLPPSLLLALSENDSEEDRVATVTMVFPSLADAETAAATVEDRIDEVVMDSTGEPFTALLKDRGVLYSVSALEDEDTGLGVLQVVFTTPDDDRSAYGLLVNAWSRRELGWLAAP